MPPGGRRWGERCSAHSSRTGAPCHAWSVTGGSVCVAHGGRAPQIKRKAADRYQAHIAQRALAAALAGEGAVLDGVVDPVLELLMALQRSLHITATLGELVKQDGVVTDAGRPSGIVRLYLDEAARAATLAAMCARIGVDVAQLGERRASITVRAFERAVHDSGVVLDDDARERLARAFGHQLRAQQLGTESGIRPERRSITQSAVIDP
jgi:hypothetical protein